MTSKQLFKKSMPFCMAKLGLGAATLLIDGILLALLMGIGCLARMAWSSASASGLR